MTQVPASKKRGRPQWPVSRFFGMRGGVALVLCASQECRISGIPGWHMARFAARSVAKVCAACVSGFVSASPVVLLASPAVVDTLAMAPMLQEQLVHHSSSPGQSRSPPRHVGAGSGCTVHAPKYTGGRPRGHARGAGAARMVTCSMEKLGVKLTFPRGLILH